MQDSVRVFTCRAFTFGKELELMPAALDIIFRIFLGLMIQFQTTEDTKHTEACLG